MHGAIDVTASLVCQCLAVPEPLVSDGEDVAARHRAACTDATPADYRVAIQLSWPVAEAGRTVTVRTIVHQGAAHRVVFAPVTLSAVEAIGADVLVLRAGTLLDFVADDLGQRAFRASNFVIVAAP